MCIRDRIPAKFRQGCSQLSSGLFSVMWGWLKAQLLLSAITFAQLSLFFYALKIDYALVLAFIVSVIDMLPVLGTGTVLLPWAAILLITGSTGRALGLLIAYLTATLVRNCLQPKLVSSQIGLNPAITIFSMYVGYCIFGITGMIFFPVLIIMVKQLNDWGYISLWK